MLIDRARIYVKAGDGGNGSAAFRREKYVPRGGPDGGDGGRGGDVVLEVRANVSSLLPFQYSQRFQADNGGSGARQKKYGKSGRPLTVAVPPGTVVFDDESDELLADLTNPGETFLVARGGRGGLGNVHFKSSTRQAPRLAELGEPGQELWLRLELRLIADVGLIGLPNAGKSSLLAAASAAQPKTADYPFTTLEPNLGVVEIGGKGGETFVMADIPGLIEGAAVGAGLGHEFLRHVTRTKVLVHVLDASGGLEGRQPLEDFETIQEELSSYGEGLPAKPLLVVLNKVDLQEARANVAMLEPVLQDRGYATYPVSAATREGMPALTQAIMASLREENARAEERAVEKPQASRRYTLDEVDERAWEARRRSAHHFDVHGVGIERLTKMTNFATEAGVDRFQQVLESSGISDELDRLGVADGDIVHIGDFELHWGPPEVNEPVARGRGRRRT